MSQNPNMTTVGNLTAASISATSVVCSNATIGTITNVTQINNCTSANLNSLDTTASVAGSLSTLSGLTQTAINNSSTALTNTSTLATRCNGFDTNFSNLNSGLSVTSNQISVTKPIISNGNISCNILAHNNDQKTLVVQTDSSAKTVFNGSVGIGTANPANTFHVIGDATFNGNINTTGNINAGSMSINNVNVKSRLDSLSTYACKAYGILSGSDGGGWFMNSQTIIGFDRWQYVGTGTFYLQPSASLSPTPLGYLTVQILQTSGVTNPGWASVEYGAFTYAGSSFSICVRLYNTVTSASIGNNPTKLQTQQCQFMLF